MNAKSQWLLLLALVPFVAAPAAYAENAPIELWPGGTPGAQAPATTRAVTEHGEGSGPRDRWVRGVAMPTLTAVGAAKPNGIGLLVVPGGGYDFLSLDKEGFDIARWFAKRGIGTFVLQYRLPAENWPDRSRVPLQDAQRALRWIRAHADDYGIDPNRIGVIGFSAGGHLAGSLATAYDRNVYADVDDVDTQSARPDFAALIYPVISMQADITHAGSRAKLLGDSPDAALVESFSVERLVTAEMPPVVLVHAVDDDVVDVQNSLDMHAAMRAAGVPADLHVFTAGGHGFGLRRATTLPVASWPHLVYRWIVATAVAEPR